MRQNKDSLHSKLHSKKKHGDGGGIGYLLRSSQVARAVCLLLVLATAFIALSVPNWHFYAKPKIDSISPQVGVPGDEVTIKGSNFGSERVKGAVYGNVKFGGYPLTQSAYLKWTDDEIVVKLPSNVMDGMVLVCTASGTSNPAFFSNALEVPVPVAAEENALPPVITSFSSTSLSIGNVLSISGSGFGIANTDSAARVLFESAGKRVAASASMGDIESWNDREINVRVADGATSGPVTVETANGTSEAKQLTVRNVNGTKYYGGGRTYLIQLASDVSDLSAGGAAHIRLYFPRPVVSSTQVEADMTECSPDVPDADYQGTSLRTLKTDTTEKKAKGDKTRYEENYAITVRSVRVAVNNSDVVTERADMNARLYDATTRSDACVPATDERIVSLAKSIAGETKGTYAIAKVIYNKMLERFKITETKADVCEPLAMLESGSGDAYDFAIVYTALLRAAGVPALPCSGILIDKDKQSKIHWWSMFYVKGVGWVPADTALGARGEGSFAALDAQHIAFSYGYRTIKNALSRSNIVQRPKSYALQSIWEESTKETRKYSSFWADPAVLGVY